MSLLEMRFAWRTGTCAIALFVLGGSTAQAGASLGEQGEAVTGDAASHGDAQAPTLDPAPLVLPRGDVALEGHLEVHASSGLVADPISIAPDLYVGATDDLTIGLVHSAVGSTGFYGFFGSGLCFAGDDSLYCQHIYNNAGAQADYRIADGEAEIGLSTGIFSGPFTDPFRLWGKVGAAAQFSVAHALSVRVEPSAFLALIDRDVAPDSFFVPATVSYAFAPFSAYVQSGVYAGVGEYGDSLTVPATAGFDAALGERANVGLAFSFPAVAGDESSFDFRTLQLSARYRF